MKNFGQMMQKVQEMQEKMQITLRYELILINKYFRYTAVYISAYSNYICFNISIFSLDISTSFFIPLLTENNCTNWYNNQQKDPQN